MATQEALLSLSNVYIRFGAVSALAIDELQLPNGAGIVATIMGPNGAGKTTLLNAISGYARVAQPGSITLCTPAATQLARRDPSKIVRLGVARTFQAPCIFRPLRVDDVLTTAVGFAAGLGRDRSVRSLRTEVIADIAARLDLNRHASTSDLTLPSARRLELARAILTGPRLLLLDEPTAGLPDADKEWLLSFLARDVSPIVAMTHGAGLSRFREVAIVLVTHDMKFLRALDLAGLLPETSILFMRAGSIRTQGSLDSVSNAREVRDEYLGM